MCSVTGPLGTKRWIAFAQATFNARGANTPHLSPSAASLLADVFYFSPVLGGFLGVAAVAVLYRVLGWKRPRDSALAKTSAPLDLAKGPLVALVGWALRRAAKDAAAAESVGKPSA